MTKFHVDLGDPPAEELPKEPPPGKLGWSRAFKSFKSLKKAVRWAKEEYQSGNLGARPDILDDNGNPINIDWDGAEWLTREELTERLHTAEHSRTQHRITVEKLQAQAAARDNEMIEAGYIPIRTLAPHLIDVLVNRDGGTAMFGRADLFMPGPTETIYTLAFRQYAARVGAEPHPFVTAMQKLVESRKH